MIALFSADHAQAWTTPAYDNPSGWAVYVCQDDVVASNGSCSSNSNKGYMRSNDFILYMQSLGFVYNPSGNSLNTEAIGLVFLGGLSMWATGAGFGMVVNMIKKLRV
ncbi:MAG: hypothetical protein HQL72_14885 [Magnetococcales bacterium]|nr:hypothetical protein [Magnetococcales bacterium]